MVADGRDKKMYSVLIGNELRATRSRLDISLREAEQLTGIHAQKLSIYMKSKKIKNLLFFEDSLFFF